MTELPERNADAWFGELASGGHAEHVAPLGTDWQVTATISFDESGSVVVSRLAVEPADRLPLGGLTARQLRAISLPKLVAEAVTFPDSPTLSAYVRQRIGVGGAVDEARPAGRPRKYDDRFLARIALEWEAETAAGRGAYGRMAARHPDGRQTTVKHWIDAATDRGFLFPAVGGGGVQQRVATPAARLLATEEDR